MCSSDLYLESVQRRDTPDPEVAYYLGLAYAGQGNDRKAITNFETARRLPDFYAAGSLKLGEIYAREHDLKQAQRYLAEALHRAPANARAAEELAEVQRVAGERESARSLANDWLSRLPDDYFLHEELGNADLTHLAADPYRVLNIASQYIRLGFYEQALRVLSRIYPAVPSDQSEPGSVLPQNHALVAYFRAWCRQKLGQPAAAEYAQASKLSTQYVFPNTAEALQVLHAALQVNPQDASAHYLLGTFYFSRGLTDAAISEWTNARDAKANIPVLDASLGLALMRIKREPAAALKIFRDGLSSDPTNDEIYFGLDQALSLTKAPASERASALERYPDSAHMPVALVYELALNRAEAGDFKGALALFHNRYFPRKEGGTNVRQVWLEVRLQQALASARNHNCPAALQQAEHLGEPVSDLEFTQNGLEPFLKSARTKYLLGAIQSECGQPQQAAENFRSAVQNAGPADLIWARAAAKKLGDSDDAKWTTRIRAELDHLRAQHAAGESSSWSLYRSGVLAWLVGEKDTAEADFQDALLLPDRSLAWHYIRVARTGELPD